MSHQPGILAEGARRVWRYQRVLWWLVAINYVLAGFATAPVSLRMGGVADHSLHSQRLVNGFDLRAFLELAANPEVSLWSHFTDSFLIALIFFVFALFLTGGILEAYRVDRKLTTREFFQACGGFFWRWVRLLIFMLIVLTPIAILASRINKWSGTLSEDAPQEKLGFWIEVVGLLLVVFLLMAVRLWFDMAQIHVVAEDEGVVRHSLVRAFKLTVRNFGSLFWLYFRIGFLAWLALGVGILIWSQIPGEHARVSFLLFEVILLWWTGTRLWQRAGETVWCQRHIAVTAVAPVAPEPVAMPVGSLPGTTEQLEQQTFASDSTDGVIGENTPE